MLNNRVWQLAGIAVESAKAIGLTNIKQEWVYAQFMHESAGMTSKLAIENKNLGGLTQEEDNGEENRQPDGNYWYKNFDSYEEYANYFGRYLQYFQDGSGVQNATTKNEYILALKDSPSGAYFGATLDEYIQGTDSWLQEAGIDDNA